MVVDTAAGMTQELTLQLTALGSLGWEAVGYACVVQMGPNAMSVLLKREAHGLPEPESKAPGWRSDPSERHEMRHWDGLRWTQHVSDSGVAATDYPNVR